MMETASTSWCKVRNCQASPGKPATPIQNEERKMRPNTHQQSELHRFNGRQHKLLPNWARPLIKYGALIILTAGCIWLAIESLF
jgi:hypothetical protein